MGESTGKHRIRLVSEWGLTVIFGGSAVVCTILIVSGQADGGEQWFFLVFSVLGFIGSGYALLHAYRHPDDYK